MMTAAVSSGKHLLSTTASPQVRYTSTIVNNSTMCTATPSPSHAYQPELEVMLYHATTKHHSVEDNVQNPSCLLSVVFLDLVIRQGRTHSSVINLLEQWATLLS